ncbi:MAG: ABC transporter ATP-binding protein [Planctomycetota bacterium]
MTTTINLAAITKTFGSGKKAATAVDQVSLSIEPGELFFLLGPSGCGKTTLLRMIAGFIEPTAGRINFNDSDVTDTPPNKRNTGMVFQSYALWPHMTVAQNVAFGLDVRKIEKAEQGKRVREALEAVQMGEYADRKPTQLSGGQQQRVALARALVIRPDVLLLDEPLSNLDAKLRNELRLEIRRICKEAGLTTVYVTHDQKEALSIADRVAIMRAGKLVQVGTPGELYRTPGSAFVASFLGETNFIEAKVVGRAEGGTIALETAGGRLAAKAPADATFGDFESVLCSVRPEAVKLLDDATAAPLRGQRVESVYLGEVAHHEIKLGTPDGSGAESGRDAGSDRPSPVLRVSELNPLPHHLGESAQTVGISVDPGDVVVLPTDDR